ncbi:uncharacterized protein V1510DRAFT_369208 [Dipodascopsis tothii]|uniref:uncharacterized protein n=1 Tax=Dipodascopsis tothii TaxID=44089 RepID=UPI0034CFC93D
MPALSPTMTEGKISSWKVKEGEPFSAGDIILEVETDKAQMDVEAQDDGVLAKIYLDASAGLIPVGESIAVLAEPDDDLASLSLPERVSATKPQAEPAAAPAPAEPAPAPTPAPAAAPPKPAAVPAGAAANPTQQLSPSVLGLILARHLTPEQALADIPATGPKGRLLKGDVLAYFGSIAQDAPKKLSEEIHQRELLDLSNIKLKKVEPKPAKAAPEAPKPAKPAVVINFDELLTFNPPRPVTKTVIRPAQTIDVVPTVVAAPSIPLRPVEVVADASAEPAPVPKKPTMSRYDELFYDLVTVPKTVSP